VNPEAALVMPHVIRTEKERLRLVFHSGRWRLFATVAAPGCFTGLAQLAPLGSLECSDLGRGTERRTNAIRSIGPAFYPPEVIQAWGAGLTPDIYVKAMEGGEVFLIAMGHIDGEPVVLGFSTHRVDDAQDGASVYVRGEAARRGIGTALLRLAEEHARAHGATSIQIQASLAGVKFYKANGFNETGRGEAVLMSGRSMPCVFMQKLLTGV